MTTRVKILFRLRDLGLYGNSVLDLEDSLALKLIKERQAVTFNGPVTHELPTVSSQRSDSTDGGTASSGSGGKLRRGRRSKSAELGDEGSSAVGEAES